MRASLSIILLFLGCITIEAQVSTTTQTTQTETVVRNGIGQVGLEQPKNITQQYTYNPTLDRYVYSEKIGKYDLRTPMFLTVE